MTVSILFANSGLVSRWSGDGVNQSNTLLRTLPASGTTSVSALVKDGTTSPTTGTSWGNSNEDVGNKYFECKLDSLLIHPSSIRFRVAGEATATNDVFNITALWLSFKKEDNPSLPQDVIIASGQYSLAIFDFNPFAGVWTTSALIPIIEANRASFTSGIGGIPTLSGQITDNVGFQGENSTLIYDWQVEVSGSEPGVDSLNNNITLYTQASSPSSGNITLYTFNSATNSGNIDLYTGGHISSTGNINLYIGGYANNSGNTDLFIQGGVLNTGNIDLYIYGYSSGVNNMPLYLANEPPGEGSGRMNLFISTPAGTEISSSMPFFMYSTENSGLYSYTTLFLKQSNSFNPLNAMNLVMPGPEALGYTSSMNLVLFQDTEVDYSLDLFLQNSYASLTGSVPLYMRGPVGTEGAVPFSGVMNLFIARDSEGVSFSAPLFLKVPEMVSGDLVSLFIDGTNINSSSIPMYIHGQHIPNNSMNLYSHGF